MTIKIEKDERVDITKGTGITNITVGLGWSPADASAKKIDVDLLIALQDETGKCPTDKDVIFFGMERTDGKLMHKSGSVTHSGDSLDGVGDGDDESALIDLTKVPTNIEKMTFVVYIYRAKQKGQKFGGIKDAYARVINTADNSEMLKYDLTEDHSADTAVIVAELYKNKGEWKFVALDKGMKDTDIEQILSMFGVSF